MDQLDHDSIIRVSKLVEIAAHPAVIMGCKKKHFAPVAADKTNKRGMGCPSKRNQRKDINMRNLTKMFE
jgi:hypothetical protein